MALPGRFALANRKCVWRKPQVKAVLSGGGIWKPPLRATARASAMLAEDRGNLDEAETILLSAHRQQPDEVEPNQKLAQFFARRATALQQRAIATEKVTEATTPGEPDKYGIYRVGGDLGPPRRAGNPVYPKEAQGAGIQGTVLAEILVNEAGIVTDARIVRSIPLLDEAALQAVREWRYDPSIVDGKAVPVRMTVNVSFTLAK